MKELIKHLLTSNLKKIADQSLINCHAVGLHSIMLIDSPEQRVRLFVNPIGGTLWRNSNAAFKEGIKMSIGFHPHHSDITLYCIQGTLVNMNVRPDINGNIKVNQFRYNSEITNGKIGFELIEEGCRLSMTTVTPLHAGHSRYLGAETYHTVFAKDSEQTAWFVFEGKANPSYQPITYSNADLVMANFSELYKPMPVKMVLDLLKSCNLLD